MNVVLSCGPFVVEMFDDQIFSIASGAAIN